MEHPMENTFSAYVTSDRFRSSSVIGTKSMVRFPMMGHGTIYSYCNRHGLFQVSSDEVSCIKVRHFCRTFLFIQRK
ncbi:MAG: hypothetical protein ACLS6W_07270 [Ruminococcus sp.]